jgi:bifunctional DNA-binding transcriptional regulator/antitoxin component of YhaV-PrlF toxin-antitoxin module
MRKSWLVCVLLGTLAWGQAAPGTPSAPQSGTIGNMARPEAPAPPDLSASVPPDAAVLTVNGVCPATPKPAAAKAAAATTAKPATADKGAATSKTADCKTVITKAQFERLANALTPNMTPQVKKQLAGVLPRVVAMSNAAEKKDLDKTPAFKETMKFYRMQVLTQALQRSIQEEAAKVPPEEIAKYYKEHADSFEQFNLDRIFVPRTKQETSEAKDDDDKGEKLSEDAQKAKQAAEKAKVEEAEQSMTKPAESLRARAAAGEDFVKLQKEAFEAAGTKIESPTINLPSVRRAALPAAHAAVFELKPGEISEVINDAGGHYIYKVNSKDEVPLDKAESEIKSTLQNQRTRDMMEKLNGSYKVETNEKYFGPPSAAMPPSRMQNPRMVPPPAMRQQQQAPPPAQPQAQKPN